MSESNQNLPLFIIVGIVAVVGIVAIIFLVTAQTTATSSAANLAGNARMMYPNDAPTPGNTGGSGRVYTCSEYRTDYFGTQYCALAH